MKPIGSALEKSGYHVVNLGYPSRKKKIEELAALAVNMGVEACPHQAGVRADFAPRAEPIGPIERRDDELSQSSADARNTLQPSDTLVAGRKSIQPLLDLLQQLVDLSQ